MNSITLETQNLLNKVSKIMSRKKKYSRITQNNTVIRKSRNFRKSLKSKSPNQNYITKLIDKYYNNDEVSKKYLQQAPRIYHKLPTQRRIIVIGDIHGDFEVAIKCLILAGCIRYIEPPINKTVSVMDAFFNTLEWIGGDTHIVQLGDQIDRIRPQRWDANDISRDTAYEDEGSTLEIFYLFHHLNELSQKYGGRVLSIIGNHEIMNVDGDFRYVSQEEFRCFQDHLKHIYHNKSKFPYHSKTLKRGRLTLYNTKHHHRQLQLPIGYRERLYAFSPTGLCSNLMAMNYYTMLQIGNWLFCHGSPTIATTSKYSIDLINNITSLYLLGLDSEDGQLEKNFDNIMHPHGDTNDDEPSILWARTFGENIKSPIQEKHLSIMLNRILRLYNNKNGNTNSETKATHIAIGHTPQFQKGINSICDERVWRCDVGMSKAFYSSSRNNEDNSLTKLPVLEFGFERGDIQVLEILNGKPKILFYSDNN